MPISLTAATAAPSMVTGPVHAEPTSYPRRAAIVFKERGMLMNVGTPKVGICRIVNGIP